MNRSIGKFAAAAVAYLAFAVYLYQPYFKCFDKAQFLLVVNVCVAAVGCLVLSRRWVGSFVGSLFAGALYGFGPYLLGLAKFHPAAGLLAALVPWLFCPAAYGPKGKWRWLRVVLATLPFVVILAFFQAAAYWRLFAVPLQAKLRIADLAGLFVPLVMADRSLALIGFYHVPIAVMLVGISMLVAARRYGVMILFAAGVVLGFCPPVLGVSPVIWLSVSVLCCSVIAGGGMAGLVSAGRADTKAVLVTCFVMAGLSGLAVLLSAKYTSIFAGLGAGYANVFSETARMYILGAIVAAIIYFFARAKMRIAWLRWAVVTAAMALDIFGGARYIVDKIF